jgi:SAM-dependent methyltransferase
VERTSVVPGSRGLQSPFTRFMDEFEQCGTHVISGFARSLPAPALTVDIGAGYCRDLRLVKAAHPSTRAVAIDCAEGVSGATEALQRREIDAVEVLDLERDRLPFDNESVDLIIANQVLEHAKEIFWIWHEVSRVLRIGGHFILGVPNVASFHNRILMLFGKHPTQWKSYSAHVRPFSKGDTLRFAEVCWPQGYEIVAFRGSQFPPFPARLSRLACALFPGAAFSIFFLFRKRAPYHREFLEHPQRASLATNFFLGR